MCVPWLPWQHCLASASHMLVLYNTELISNILYWNFIHVTFLRNKLYIENRTSHLCCIEIDQKTNKENTKKMNISCLQMAKYRKGKKKIDAHYNLLVGVIRMNTVLLLFSDFLLELI